MDKIRFSKTDSRRTVMALAIVAMFVATLGVGNFELVISLITSVVLSPETLITAIPDTPGPDESA